MKRLSYIFCLMLFSCVTNLPLPQINMPEHYLYESVATADSLGGEWWRIYDDAVLDSLQREALRSNHDLAVAASRVVSAQYNLSVARAAFLPTIGAELSVEGKYITPQGDSYEWVLQPTISWNVSLFGALRHTNREAQAQILSTVWGYRGVVLSLTKEVASAYYTILQCRQSLDIAERSHRLRVESAALIDSMARYGTSTALELDQAQSLVYTAAADIAQYTRSLRQAQFALAILLGQEPESGLNIPIDRALAIDALPEQVPAGLPSEIMNRRPDIMESYYALQAAAAKVGIARSNRFPSIPLTAGGGLFGQTVKELFTEGYWNWSLSGSIVQPIFGFGRLRRQEQIAREAYKQQAEDYEQTVLTALQEVESALVAIQTYRAQVERYEEYVQANGRIAQLTEALYRMGMSNYLDVISTAQTWYESQLQLVEILSQQYINYAELVMALGDGWQEVDSQ